MRLERISKGLVMLSWLLAALSATGQQNNIILIFCDDLNMAGEAQGGHPQAFIPGIEQLMADGVTFTNAHTNAPRCGPSRSSIWSGLYPHTAGMYGYQMSANPWYSNPVIAESDQLFRHFKSNGYQVYGAGKIYHHFVQDSIDIYFDDYGVSPSSGPFPFGGNLNGVGHPSMPDALSGKHDGIAPLSDIPIIGTDTGWVDKGEPWRYVNDLDRDLMNDERIAQYADSLLQIDHEQPFFLTLGFSKPHTPMYVPQAYFDMYPLEEMQIPFTMEGDLDDVMTTWINNGALARTGLNSYYEMLSLSEDSVDTQWWIKRFIQGYLACTSFVDQQIADVIESVQNSEYADNTYIILTSDHGHHLGEKNGLSKTSLWDAATQVPFIVSGPDVPASSSTNAPVSLIDVYPTLIDLADLPQPQHQLEGFSVRGLMEDPASEAWEGPSVALTAVGAAEQIPTNIVAPLDHQHFSVRSEDYRYTLTSAGEEELYDHVIDPYEWFNIADDPSYIDIKADLRAELIEITGFSPLELPDSNLLRYGSFEQKFNGWFLMVRPGSTAEFIHDSSDQVDATPSARIEVTEVDSTDDRSVQMINSSFAMAQGQEYSIRFWAKSASEESRLLWGWSRNGIPDTQTYDLETVELGADWNQYEIILTFQDSTTQLNARMFFRFLDTDTYWIDDVRITPTDPLAIQVVNDVIELSIHPNPAKDRLHVSMDSKHLPAELSLFSQNGQIVSQNRMTFPEDQVDLRSLSPGVYFLVVEHEREITTRKVVVSR